MNLASIQKESIMKPWSVNVGLMAGLLVGAMIWWASFENGMGLFQNPQLMVVPAAIGVLIPILHNKWFQVGQFDPLRKERNDKGRL